MGGVAFCRGLHRGHAIVLPLSCPFTVERQQTGSLGDVLVLGERDNKGWSFNRPI